jgi:hypothetical protein
VLFGRNAREEMGGHESSFIDKVREWIKKIM